MAQLPRTCSSSYATLNCTDEVTWVLPHQQDGGFIDVSVMISTLEHNKSSTRLGQTITASQWVKIKPVGSIKAFIWVHHPFSLIFGFISSPLQWIVDFCKVFKHTRHDQVWPVDLNAVYYCYSFFSPYSKDRIPASPAQPTSIPHAEYACGPHDKILNYIPDSKWQTCHICIYLYIRILKNLKELSRNLQGVPGKLTKRKLGKGNWQKL